MKIFFEFIVAPIIVGLVLFLVAKYYSDMPDPDSVEIAICTGKECTISSFNVGNNPNEPTPYGNCDAGFTMPSLDLSRKLKRFKYEIIKPKVGDKDKFHITKLERHPGYTGKGVEKKLHICGYADSPSGHVLATLLVQAVYE